RQAGLPQGSLALARGSERGRRQGDQPGDVRERVREDLRGRPLLEDHAVTDWPLLSMGPQLDVRAGAAVLPELLGDAAGDDPGHRWRARARVGRRLGDNGPHLACWV